MDLLKSLLEDNYGLLKSLLEDYHGLLKSPLKGQLWAPKITY